MKSFFFNRRRLIRRFFLYSIPIALILLGALLLFSTFYDLFHLKAAPFSGYLSEIGAKVTYAFLAKAVATALILLIGFSIATQSYKLDKEIVIKESEVSEFVESSNLQEKRIRIEISIPHNLSDLDAIVAGFNNHRSEMNILLKRLLPDWMNTCSKSSFLSFRKADPYIITELSIDYGTAIRNRDLDKPIEEKVHIEAQNLIKEKIALASGLTSSLGENDIGAAISQNIKMAREQFENSVRIANRRETKKTSTQRAKRRRTSNIANDLKAFELEMDPGLAHESGDSERNVSKPRVVKNIDLKR